MLWIQQNAKYVCNPESYSLAANSFAAVLAGQSAVDALFQHLYFCEDLRLEPPTVMKQVGIAAGNLHNTHGQPMVATAHLC